MNTDNIEQTQTVFKPVRKLSYWNIALQEFNKGRPQGSKFVMPKKDTEDYLKVKAISERLKNDTSVASLTEPKVKKPRLKKIKEEVSSTEVIVTEKVKKPRAKKVQIDIPPSV